MRNRKKLLFLFLLFLLLILQGCYRAPMEEPYRVKEIESLIKRAKVASEKGNFKMALSLYEEALKKSRIIQDDNSTVVILLSLSRIYTSLDKIDYAKKFLSSAEELSKKTYLPEGLSEEIIFEKARIGFLLNENSEALLHKLIYSESPYMRIKSLNLLARFKMREGANEEAEELLNKALSMNNEISKIEQANTLRLLGELNTKKNKNKALIYLLRALSIDKELALPEKIALDMEILARLYRDMEDKEKAKDYFLRAFEIWKCLEREENQIRIMRELEIL